MRRRTGSTAVHFAIALTTILAVTAVVIDIGRGRVFKQQARNAAEAAAHAGAAQLDGTAAGILAARDMAVQVASENLMGGTGVTLDPNLTNDPTGDVVTGYWEDEEFVPSTTPAETTTVQVVAQRDDVDTVLTGYTFSKPTIDVGDFAIAQAGGPASAACPFPLAMPDCEFVALPNGFCGSDLTLNSARVDNGAWSRVGSTQANASYIRDALDPSVCAGASGVEDLVTLNNGQVNSAFREMGDAVNAYGSAWIPAEYGGTIPAQSAGSVVSPYGQKTLVGQIVIFDDPDNCANTQFAGTHPIVGYATIVIYDVVNQGSAKTIKARTLCTMTDGAGGGGFFGTTVPPNFVR